MVKTGRKMLGATNPLDSNPGTIRGDFCIDVGRYVLDIFSSLDLKAVWAIVITLHQLSVISLSFWFI